MIRNERLILSGGPCPARAHFPSDVSPAPPQAFWPSNQAWAVTPAGIVTKSADILYNEITVGSAIQGWEYVGPRRTRQTEAVLHRFQEGLGDQP